MPPAPGATALVAAAPVGYLALLRRREYVGLLASRVVSLVGDQLARVALTVLVFDRTGSASLSALTYAVTFLPVVLGGPLLGGLADRLPRRRLLVVADLLRAALFALMAAPGVPLTVLLLLVLLAALVEAPWAAARAPLMREVLTDEAGYQRGSGLDEALDQSGQVLGFLAAGGLLLVMAPTTALLLDAGTFLLSALVVRLLLDPHPPVERRHERQPARLDAVVGVRAATAPGARRPLLLALSGLSLSIAPEALAVPYAAQLGGGPLLAGLVLAMNPLGSVVGLLLVGGVPPGRARHWLLPMALLTLVPLLALALPLPTAVVLALLLLSGIASSYSLPARVAFVEAVPVPVRGRAFAAASSALSTGQGLGIALAAGLAAVVDPGTAIAGCAAVGLGLVLLSARCEGGRRTGPRT